MQRKFKVTMGFLVLAGLAACTNATPPTPTPTPTPTRTFPELITPTAPNYVTMNDTRIISVPVSGDLLYAGPAGRLLFGSDTVSGTYSTSDGAIIITIGDFTFIDADGPDADGQLVMGPGWVNGTYNTATFTATLTDYGPEYQYVKSLGINLDHYRAQPIARLGPVGILTNTLDMPTAGIATFAGGATAIFFTGPTKTELGTSRFVADFAAGTADVELKFSSGFLTAYGNPISGLIVRQVNGTGLQIAGNAISGGTFTALSGPDAARLTPVDLTGRVLPLSGPPETNIASGGSFYGYDAASGGPAEMAGLIQVNNTRV